MADLFSPARGTAGRGFSRRQGLRWLLGSAAMTGVGFKAAGGWLSAGPGWTGPVTDHFDGRVFFNPGSMAGDASFLDLMRWRFSGGAADWPERAGLDCEPLAATPPAPAVDGEIMATFVGHATFLLQWRGLVMLTDPVWSDRCSPVPWAGPKRVRPPAVNFEALPPVDVVLLSHNHYDHLDVETLKRLDARCRPLIVTGLGNRAFLESCGLTHVVELDWWEAHTVGGALLTLVPAVHWSSRGGSGRNATLWGGFMIEAAGTRTYYAGDTGYGPHFAAIRQRLGPPDLALLPIGAYEPRWFMKPVHMNPEEAVQAHRELGARHSVGLHFGTWQLTDEAIDAPVRDLAAARRAAGVEETTFRAPEAGETVRVTAG